MAKPLKGSIELSKLKSAITTTAKGTKCIMIPLDQKGINLFKETRVFLNFNLWEKEGEYSIALNKEKEETETIYIGNAKYEIAKSNTPSGPEPITNDNEDDLPF